MLCLKHLQDAKPILSPIEQYVVDLMKRKRHEKGWSQKDLAYEMNFSMGFIGDVENPKERAKYNLDHINELAKYSNVRQKIFYLIS